MRAAKDLYDRTEDASKLPEDDLVRMAMEIEFERAGERLKAGRERKQHGG